MSFCRKLFILSMENTCEAAECFARTSKMNNLAKYPWMADITHHATWSICWNCWPGSVKFGLAVSMLAAPWLWNKRIGKIICDNTSEYVFVYIPLLVPFWILLAVYFYVNDITNKSSLQEKEKYDNFYKNL